MVKENVDIKIIKSLNIDVFEHLSNIEEFGHVGCYDITKDKVQELSSKIIKLLEESNKLLEEIGEGIVNSYEY